MSAFIPPVMRKMRRLALCMLAVLLLSPQAVSGSEFRSEDSGMGRSETLNGTIKAYLPVVLRQVFYPNAKACLVTDSSGVEDESFNEAAWNGVQDAVVMFHMVGEYLEPTSQSDYANRIDDFIADDCDLIVTVGWTMRDATAEAASDHLGQKFSIVDVAYDPTQTNILSQVYASDQAAFLAGYLAAGVTSTGKVATYGGMNLPTVTLFMDGFVLGVRYFNQVHSTTVEVLGWNPDTQDGLFIDSFTDTEDGELIANTLMSAGVDIIFPVAGPAGLGSAAAADVQGSTFVIGVDVDWYVTAPDYKEVFLTSVMKNVDVTTFIAIRSVLDGIYAGGLLTGNLQNDGVGLAPYHDLDAQVSPELQAELSIVRAGIIAGTIPTTPSE